MPAFFKEIDNKKNPTTTQNCKVCYVLSLIERNKNRMRKIYLCFMRVVMSLQIDGNVI